MNNQWNAHQPDFLIIGAGPAGLIAGIQLQRQGHKVTILDKNTSQVRSICGEYLSPEGKELLLEMKLGSTITDFNPVKGMLIFSPHGQKIETEFPPERCGLSLNREIFQTRLSHLFTALGGCIHYNSPVKAISIQDSQVWVNETYHPSWLIGADGRQSIVARLLNMRHTSHNSKRLALHCYLRPKNPLPEFGQMHILPDGSYVGINPISTKEVNFSIVTTPLAIAEAGGVKELINFWIKTKPALSEQFNEINNELIKTTSPISRRSLDIVGEKMALIGDASGFIDPLTGEGITTAIKSARLFVQEVSEARGIDAGILNYGKRRIQDFAEKEKLNLGFQTLIKYPLACESVALALSLSKRVRNTFICVVGNVYTPSQAVKSVVNGYLTERF